jgi:TetR/AcrR family transcriptional regulator, ethionamide resistance regulator
VLKSSTHCKVARVTTLSEAGAPRGRRSTRPSGDDREQAILATAERLLAQRPFGEISVDDLARGAGLSRPTFYFYFPSKDAVLLTLWERVIVEADSALEVLVANPPADLRNLWRIGIDLFFETFGAHRAVTLAAQAARTSSEEVRTIWATFMQKWIDHIATVIDVERGQGAAPVTLPARELSTALNLMNERVMWAAYADDQPSVPDARVLDTLVHIWTTAIYGELP